MAESYGETHMTLHVYGTGAEEFTVAMTILKVKRDNNCVLAVLDGSVGASCRDTYRVGPWALLKVRQGGHFPLAEFLSWNSGIEPESLEGWEVEKV
jgi:hypothetical protein